MGWMDHGRSLLADGFLQQDGRRKELAGGWPDLAFGARTMLHLIYNHNNGNAGSWRVSCVWVVTETKGKGVLCSLNYLQYLGIQ
jgi:hypothetical protein